MALKYHTVYKVTNRLTGDFYIGKHSTNDINDPYLGSGAVLLKALEAFGRDCFEKDILYVFSTEEEAYEKEAELLTEDVLNHYHCLNRNTGGTGWSSGELNPNHGGKVNKGRKHSQDYCDAIRRRQLGHEVTEETRKKISDAKQGVKLTTEHIEKMRKSLTGKKRSPEVIEKTRSKLIGQKRTPEQRRRMSEARKGIPSRPWTEEERRAISIRQTGKVHSDATKRKISDKAKARYAAGQPINCKIYDIPPKEDLEFLYIEQGYSANLVSKMMGVSIPTLRKWIISYGIPYSSSTSNARHERVESSESPALMEIYSWVKSLCPDAEHSYSMGGKNYDIYVPSRGLLIEYNGLFFHSERFAYKIGRKTVKEIRTMHRQKVDVAADHGLRCFFIWEDTWRDRPDVIKEFLSGLLRPDLRERVYARKCDVLPSVPRHLADAFMDAHHLQGAVQRYSTAIGLAYRNQIVAVCLFANDGNHTMNLVRYAVDPRYQINGGFARMVSHFMKGPGQGHRLITFGDLTYILRTDNVYLRNEFKEELELKPDYQYVWNNERVHKFNFRRDSLRRLFGPGFKEELSEYQNCINNDVFRVWDAGKIRYELTQT